MIIARVRVHSCLRFSVIKIFKYNIKLHQFHAVVLIFFYKKYLVDCY